MWPEIGYPDIYIYLISTPGKYTSQSLKAYKSLDGWSFFKAGFVGEIKVMRTSMDILVVCGQVCILSKLYIFIFFINCELATVRHLFVTDTATR